MAPRVVAVAKSTMLWSTHEKGQKGLLTLNVRNALHQKHKVKTAILQTA